MTNFRTDISDDKANGEAHSQNQNPSLRKIPELVWQPHNDTIQCINNTVLHTLHISQIRKP